MFVTDTNTNRLYINPVCPVAVAFHLGSNAFITLMAHQRHVDNNKKKIYNMHIVKQ